MTEIAKTLLDRYQIRKTGKQKTEFMEFVRTFAEARGYSCSVEKGAFGVRNIVVGDPDAAKVVFGAHYDTCAVLPFPNFITPKHFGIYLLYQLLLVVGMLAVVGAVSGIAHGIALLAGTQLTFEAGYWITYLTFLLLLFLMMAGPANKHTVNDNSSGVITLLELMDRTAPDGTAAFVFFDLEEAGLLGSAAFASKHKTAMKDKLLINFDCVSDGEHVIFALRPKAKDKADLLCACYPSAEAVQCEVLTKGVFYPSDQANFPQGVGVAALKRAKRWGILYMDRIHTPKDTVYRAENIAFLTEGSARLIQRMKE